MKNTSKPVPKTPAKQALPSKAAAAKPKPKPASKPKPRQAQSQAALLPIVERLAQAAERLAEAAERLVEATTSGPEARAHEAVTRENPTPDTVS